MVGRGSMRLGCGMRLLRIGEFPVCVILVKKCADLGRAGRYRDTSRPYDCRCIASALCCWNYTIYVYML